MIIFYKIFLIFFILEIFLQIPEKFHFSISRHFHFTFHFSKRVNQIFISHFTSRNDLIKFSFHFSLLEKSEPDFYFTFQFSNFQYPLLQDTDLVAIHTILNYVTFTNIIIFKRFSNQHLIGVGQILRPSRKRGWGPNMATKGQTHLIHQNHLKCYKINQHATEIRITKPQYKVSPD